jgi:hypothetical protein
MTADLDGALRLFALASDYVRCAGLLVEIDWQRDASILCFSETEFLRESAWVILCSGFRESLVRRIFNYVSLCFCDWESASSIVEADTACRAAAMASFRNQMKLDAILRIAHLVNGVGFSSFKEMVLSDPIGVLGRLPYIGPVTVWHLAKNLGLDVSKPDRHLVRVSNQFGFYSAAQFCTAIADATGEPAKVVDLIVWRYLANNSHNLRKTRNRKR